MTKRTLLICVFSLTLLPWLHAQDRRVDSLTSLVKSVPADTTKVWLLNELVSSIIDRQERGKSLEYAREARDLASLLNYKPGLARSLELLGWIHYRQGDYTTSFEYSNRALKLNEELNNGPGIARVLISLAAIVHEQKYYDQAILNFRKAYALSEKHGDLHTMTRCLNNIAFNMVNLEEYDSASYYVTEAVRLGSEINNQYLVSFSMRTQGDIYFGKKDFNKAIKKYTECLLLAEKIGNNFIRASTLHRLGKTYKEINQLDNAIVYLLANFDFARKYDYKEELERTSLLLSQIYVAKSDFLSAYNYQAVYLAVHDSLFDQRKADQLAFQQARFDSEIKQTQIELLTKDTHLKQEQIASQRVWLYFYIGLLILVVLIVFVLLMNNHFNKKAKHELELKNLEIQRQAQQLSNVNAAKDKLFSIISHDLRSPVASLRGLMEVIGAKNLSQDQFIEVTQKLKKNLDVVYDDLDNVLQWAQSQLRGIQVQREEIQLRPMVEEIVSLFYDALKIKGITAHNEIDEDVIVLADRNQLKLIFRNLIANSIKFNEPEGMIRVFVRSRKHKVEVSVADSGIGIGMDELHKLFNAETHFTKPGTNKEKGIGIGLLLTKEFVENNGGAIWVTSELGKGATFTFTLDQVMVEKKEGALSPSLAV
jgi:two-component system, sensor histidine kinase and response regulator